MDETNLIKALRNAVSNLYELAEQLERQIRRVEVMRVMPIHAAVSTKQEEV